LHKTPLSLQILSINLHFMAKKFIINDNRIIIGQVEFHYQLATDHSKTIGGGLWFYDHLSDTMYLYGASTDYGPVTFDQVRNAWSYSLEGKTIMFSHQFDLEKVLKESICINNQTAFAK